MTASKTLRELSALLRSRPQLLAAGSSDRELGSALERGELHRLSPGQFIETGAWQGLSPAQRHLLRAVCAQRQASSPLVFSHRTAAMMLGLPLLHSGSDRVHVLQPPDRDSGSSGNVARHRQSCRPDEVIETDGLLHTDLSRTMLDLARFDRFENGVLVGDAGLRVLSGEGGIPAETVRAELMDRLSRMPGTRGHRRARHVLQLLDDSAESPLESLYRLQFRRLGFDVHTQVAVPSPTGGSYRVDFELVGHRAFFEADGRAKYTDERLRNGKSLEQVLLAEREREVYVQGRYGYRVLRGGWDHALTPGRTAELLRRFRVEPPRDFERRPFLHLY